MIGNVQKFKIRTKVTRLLGKDVTDDKNQIIDLKSHLLTVTGNVRNAKLEQKQPGHLEKTSHMSKKQIIYS